MTAYSVVQLVSVKYGQLCECEGPQSLRKFNMLAAVTISQPWRVTIAAAKPLCAHLIFYLLFSYGNYLILKTSSFGGNLSLFKIGKTTSFPTTYPNLIVKSRIRNTGTFFLSLEQIKTKQCVHLYFGLEKIQIVQIHCLKQEVQKIT